MNVSEVMAQYLRAAGVDVMFGYPGDPSVELLEGCRNVGVDFILGRREGTAGLMAQAYGMLTGKPGVALSTLGPGATNLVNAVANAYLDRTPMIAISGQIDTKRLPTFTHQVVDQHSLFTPVSKWATSIAPHTAGHIMRKAHRTAMAPRQGPVHITTPADYVGAEATDDEIHLPPTNGVGHGVVVYGEGADPVAMINKANRPVILYGISAMQGNAGAEIAALAERIGAALVSSPMAKGTVGETHPLFAGVLDMACNAQMWDLVRSADLVIAAGFDGVELIKPWDVSAPVLHIDTVPNTDQIYASPLEMVGSISHILAALADEVKSAEGFTEGDIRTHRDALMNAYEAGRVSGILNPSDVIRIAKVDAPTDTIVTADVGSHKLLVGQGWTTHNPRSCLNSNGLSSMGFSLPAAMVAKYLYPDRNVICFTGDGGLAMVQSELRLAASLGLGLKIVVFCDNSLNRIELKQMARQYPSTGTVIEDTDIVKMAECMACDGVMVDNEQDLADALATPMTTTPLVIGARIDPKQYWTQF